MKTISRFLLFVLTIVPLLLGACAGTAPTSTTAAPKVEPIPVAFLGIVDSIADDQWVINGQTVTVTPDVIQDGPFNVGDQVKVEGVVNSDGSFTVSRVEVPTAQDSSTLPQFGNENVNAIDNNGNDANVNDGNINDDNTNDDNNNNANFNDNANDDNGNGNNSNDDNGNDANSNDDNSNDANSNDDNSNDDNSNDDNSNNDNGGNDNNSGSNDNGGDNDNIGNGG
jgi:hypothetical protein